MDAFGYRLRVLVIAGRIREGEVGAEVKVSTRNRKVAGSNPVVEITNP